MDGALTVPPRVQAVPPVRNTSASSMQSPPTSAEATSVIILSPVFARPGARPRSRWLWVNEFPAGPDAPGEGGRQEQTGIGHQAVIVKDDTDTVGGGCVVASIGCSFSGVGFLLQNHYPRSTGAPSCRFRTLTRRPPSVDSGLGTAPAHWKPTKAHRSDGRQAAQRRTPLLPGPRPGGPGYYAST